MGGSNLLKNHRITDIFYLLLIILFLTFVIFGFTKDTSPDSSSSISMLSEWTDENGKSISLDELPSGEEVCLTADLKSLAYSGKQFCFKSVDTVLEVYADGKLIYSYRPTQPELLGRSYGMFVHTIPLPDNSSELTLQAEPIFKSTHANISDAFLEDPGTYITKLYRNNLLVFIRSCLTFLVGILLLAMGLSNKLVSASAGLDFVSLGKMCVLLGFSGLNDTYILQMLTQQPSIIRAVTYLCLALMPYPALQFFASASGARDSKLIPLMRILCYANVLVSIVLTLLGITDYYYTVNVTHIIILLDFAMLIYIVARSIAQHRIRPQLIKCLTIGLSVSVIGGATDLLRYHFGLYDGYNTYSRVGIILFIVILVAYLFREQIRTLENKQKENTIFISEITEAFAKVIDMRDRYTSGHSARVAKYTAMLAN